MSTLFDEWFKRYGVEYEHQRPQLIKSWWACKAEAIRLLKTELHVPIEQKKRSFEDILEDL